MGEITGSGIEEQAVIERAEILYELLTEEDKLTVTEEYTLLQQAEEAFSIWQAEFDNVQEVVYGTEQMGDVTITGAESYQEVKDAYDMLSENAKKLLPDEIKERLSEAADTYQQLLAQQEKTEEVVKKIDDASIISDLSDEAAVKAARKAYDALENPYRVTNYETLLEEEKEILSLKKVQENQKFANTVITQINALKKVTLSDKEKVEAARRAYDGLTDAQKNLVDNPYSTEVTFSNVKQLDNAEVLLEITTENNTYEPKLVRYSVFSDGQQVSGGTKVQLNSKSDGVTDNNIVYVTDENGKDINSLLIDKNETKKIVVNSCAATGHLIEIKTSGRELSAAKEETTYYDGMVNEWKKSVFEIDSKSTSTGRHSVEVIVKDSKKNILSTQTTPFTIANAQTFHHRKNQPALILLVIWRHQNCLPEKSLTEH